MSTEIVILSNTRARLVTSDLKVRSAVDKVCSFTHVGHEHTNAFRRWLRSSGKAGWDGQTHLLTKGASTFPLGLLPLVERALTKIKVSVKVVDCRSDTHIEKALGAAQVVGRGPVARGARKQRPEALAHRSEVAWQTDLARILPGKVLRPDQVDAVRQCIRQERGLIWSATGGGKTEIAIALTKLLRTHDVPGKVLFLSNRKKLLRDTHARFVEGLKGTESSLWPKTVGFISEGAWDDDAMVIIGSVSTLAHPNNKKRLAKFVKSIGTLIVDEAHHVGSKSWSKLIMRIPARVRIGLSGTPLDRGDGKNLLVIAALGEVIHETRSSTLIEAGMLARPTVHITPCRVPDELDDADYELAYAEGIVGNLWRNRQIVRLCERTGKTLVLVNHIEHGRNIIAALNAGGWHPPEFLHGQTDAATIDRTVREFRNGKHPVMVASSIFREGIDIPETDAVIIGDAGKSVIKMLQQIGRGIRRKAGDNTVKVHDFADTINRHLARHSMKRIATYRREGFNILFEE